MEKSDAPESDVSAKPLNISITLNTEAFHKQCQAQSLKAGQGC